MRDDGGPAFPMPMTMMTGEHIANEPEFGMTLRDYFAAKAMQALIGGALLGATNSIAIVAYEYADAMLKARSE